MTIKYYDNKESHGMIIDWKAVFKRFKEVMKEAQAPDNLFDPTTAPVDKAKYLIYMSERETGKTTNLIILGMILNQMYGTQIQYIRQTEDMIKPSVANEIFNVILSYNDGTYIDLITDGKWQGIYIHWKKAYFCTYDENGKVRNQAEKPFLQYLSLDHNEQYKSVYNAPTGDFLLFDEFISSNYRIDEFFNLMDLTKTIIRGRKTPVIFMLANTINLNSPYFREFEISKEIKKLKVGKSVFVETEKGTDIYVEIIGLKPSRIKSEVNRLYFGFNNPRMAAITGGEQTWSFERVQHIVNSETDELVNRQVRLDCFDVMLQLDIVRTEDRGVIVNVHECTKSYPDSIILTNGDITKRNEQFGLGKGELCELVWSLYRENKWYYDSDQTGSYADNYVKTYRQVRK